MNNLFKKVVKVRKEETVLISSIEKAAELSIALSQQFQYNMEETMDELISSVADMEIMLAQIKYMYIGVEFEDKVDYIKKEKLDNLEIIINQEAKNSLTNVQ